MSDKQQGLFNDDQIELEELKVSILDSILGSADANLKLLEGIKYNLTMIQLRVERIIEDQEDL